MGCLSSHDPAYIAHTILSSAAAMLLHFHTKFFGFYDAILRLIILLSEETKKIDVHAGGQLCHDLHQGIYETFQQAHQGYASFNVIRRQACTRSCRPRRRPT